MMAYKSTYHHDSDADDEYERSVMTSPTMPAEFDASPTDSEPPSAEHTPTTYTHSGGSHNSPTALITQWTPEQVADFLSALGLPQYGDTFMDEVINGEALAALQHGDLKDLGMTSVGHRLTVLKSVYDVKVKQNVPFEEDHYVPLSAEAEGKEAAATQEDFSRIINIIRDRDERIRDAEAELRNLKDDLSRFMEENRKLREEVLPLVRMAKDRSHPLPTPDGISHPEQLASPPADQPRSGSGLARKFSTKKLFLGSGPKNPSPTIVEGRTVTDNGSLEPSAAAMTASNHLTASISGGSQPANSPMQPNHPSPTSPAYSTHNTINRSFPSRDDQSIYSSTASTIYPDRGDSRSDFRARPMRSAPTPTPDNQDPPLSGGSSTQGGSTLNTGNSANTPSSAGSGGSSNPQVEIFKSFRVSIDDPCHKVLPVALKKYNITADWRQYALYIVHGDQERCLGLNERPLILFKQLDKEGRKPMFMLRKHAAPDVGHVNTVGGSGPPQPVAPTGGGGWAVPGGVL